MFYPIANVNSLLNFMPYMNFEMEKDLFQNTHSEASVSLQFRPDPCTLIMNLGSFLHDKPPNIENEKFYHLGHVVRWMRCAAEGLRYLHNASPEPIIHRDIKPDNCLLFDDGLRIVVFKNMLHRNEQLKLLTS